MRRCNALAIINDEKVELDLTKVLSMVMLRAACLRGANRGWDVGMAMRLSLLCCVCVVAQSE